VMEESCSRITDTSAPFNKGTTPILDCPLTSAEAGVLVVVLWGMLSVPLQGVAGDCSVFVGVSGGCRGPGVTGMGCPGVKE